MPIIKRLQQHKILLDTHVWLWVMEGNTQLSSAFRQALERTEALEHVYVSAISILEIGMLAAKKRIELEMDCLDWVNQALAFPGIQLSPISPRIAIQSTRLPGVVHGDPADRILIATAYEENAVLVTCDAKLLEYGEDSFISVYNPLQGVYKMSKSSRS
jgi:PIN domain nuclease of toxin-antitoxin system